MVLNKAVFVDKDGTLVENIPFNANPAQLQLAKGAREALKRLYASGFTPVVVTNQSGIALGHFSERAMGLIENKIKRLLEEGGVPLGGFYYCPHHPRGRVRRYAARCFCRKPKPGLLLRAAREKGIDLAHSWFIGDILDDVEAGRAAGCQTVLLNCGNETEWKFSVIRNPHVIVNNWRDAAKAVLSPNRERLEAGVLA